MRHHLLLAAAACTAALSGCADVPGPDGEAAQATTLAAPDDCARDRVVRVDHTVVVGPGRRLAVTETFAPRALARGTRRAILMIASQGANRTGYNAPFPGYDGGELLARAGYFAFSVDPEGSGDSTYPADGFSVTYEREAASMRPVIEHIQRTRRVARVDIFGEEVGGGVAMHVCADATLARTCTAASMTYRRGSDFFNATVGGPGFQALVFGAPSGYFTTVPELYFNVLAGATPELSAWFLRTQGGRYSAGTYVQDFQRILQGGDSFDPRHAAVPGLILMGERDPNPAPGDTADLAAAYGSIGGGVATVEVVPGGTHILRLDAPPVGDHFWQRVIAFLDAH